MKKLSIFKILHIIGTLKKILLREKIMQIILIMEVFVDIHKI